MGLIVHIYNIIFKSMIHIQKILCSRESLLSAQKICALYTY